jgi:FkbM family methyltransferase
LKRDFKEKIMISGIILARNEESNIVDCIKSLRPHVSEVILIDMESSDATIELARPIVDKLLRHKLIANFDTARNIAIPEASYEWLWFVDADERIPQQTGQLVNNIVRDQGNEFEAISIPFKTHFCGKWIEHSGWWPGYTMPRVLKKGHFRFAERLHGGVDTDGREIRLAPDPGLSIEHFSYRSIEHYIDKINRYTSTEAAQLKAGGQSIDWRNAISHMVHDLWMYYERNRGDLDGRHGWVLAWLSGQYRWLSHAKLMDLDSTAAEPSSQLIPGSLDDVLSVMELELEGLRRFTPQLPLGVVLRSPIWDLSGYADEARCIAKALSFGDRNAVVEEIPWSTTRCRVSRADKALYRALLAGRRCKSNLTITNCIPTLAIPDRSSAINVLRTTFEAERIPKSWMPYLDRFDELWVISKHNELAFVRSGVAPEKLRRIPSFLDTDIYCPDGAKIELPDVLSNRFVFLSVFDWQLRKGWDVLLTAYCRTFSDSDGAGLILKISRAHGRTLQGVFDQANEVIASLDQSLSSRPDILFVDAEYSTQEMANLYRSVNAFVLPSRGEGWGRPYMEAMACGLPTIGTGASGNVDFMNNDNSLLIDAMLVDIPQVAVDEIPVYEGNKWFEPCIDSLSVAMKSIKNDTRLRNRISHKATEYISSNHDMISGMRRFQTAVKEAERRFERVELSAPIESQIKLTWEGEFFAGHSFSNINEQLVRLLFDDDRFAIKLDRKIYNPTVNEKNTKYGMFESYMIREFEYGPDVVVRHSFPPNWTRPEEGRWIHIQPWEFGHLPKVWVAPLQNEVDEIWVPTDFVKKVYINSGIDSNKIFVIPWGIDPAIFNPDVPARILPTSKSFRFVFVGGTIHRKGFDRVLNAYLEEFGPEEDVCLVIKDLGVDSFYRYGNLRNEIKAAQENRRLPEIVYFDDNWTPGQLASLYVGCDCLVMPYRGEGFGLPILEGMACGIPAIVPRGGASDDFVTDKSGYLLNSHLVESTHNWELVGPAMELEINPLELMKKMRFAFEHSDEVHNLGRQAAKSIGREFTWERTARMMSERIIAQAQTNKKSSLANDSVATPCAVACVIVEDDETEIAECLARLVPFVRGVVVLDGGCCDRSLAVAREYGATVVTTLFDALKTVEQKGGWCLFLRGDEKVDSDGMQSLNRLLGQLRPHVLAASVCVVNSDESSSDSCPLEETRLLRCNSMIFDAFFQQPWLTISEVECMHSIQRTSLDIKIWRKRTSPIRIGAGRQGLHERWVAPYVPVKGRVFIDIGANVGLWTKCLANHFESVHAIEPNPDVIPSLRIGLPSNATVHEIAAWSAETAIEFSKFEQSVHLSCYYRTEGIHTGPSCGQITLAACAIDSLPIDGVVDFVKCDVEGAEIEVLQGASKLILRDRPWLLVEVHSAENFRRLTRLLDQWNYVFTIIRDPNYEPFSDLWQCHCWFSCQPELPSS